MDTSPKPGYQMTLKLSSPMYGIVAFVGRACYVPRLGCKRDSELGWAEVYHKKWMDYPKKLMLGYHQGHGGLFFFPLTILTPALALGEPITKCITKH